MAVKSWPWPAVGAKVGPAAFTFFPGGPSLRSSLVRFLSPPFLFVELPPLLAPPPPPAF